MRAPGPKAKVGIVAGLAGVAVIGVAIAASYGPQVGCEFPGELVTAKYLPFQATAIGENYRCAIGWDGGDTSIVRRMRSRADPNSQWEVEPDREYSVSYRITAVAHREGGDVLYIAGIRESDCVNIIEEWTFPRQTGGYQLQSRMSPTSTPAVPPIGTTPLPFLMQSVVVGGGPYVPPSLRGGRIQAPKRKVVYEGTSFGPVRCMVSDPEGRFLLLQGHGDSSIYQLDTLQPYPVVPQVLFTPAQHPALLDTTTLDVYGHPALSGRMFMMTTTRFGVTGPGAEWVVMFDDDNDGVVEPVAEFDESSWPAGPFADQSLWKEFVNEGGFEIQPQ